MARRPSTNNPMRLEIPSELTVHEKYQWEMLMRRAPLGHFLPVDVPAIIAHCQMMTLQARLYPKVRDVTATKEECALFLAMMAQLKSSFRNLRIGPSTRNAQRDRAGRNARDHGDAFDPEGASWQEVLQHGRGGRA